MLDAPCRTAAAKIEIATYYTQFGLGKGEHFDLEVVAGEVDDADVIALQIVELYWQPSGNIDQTS